MRAFYSRILRHYLLITLTLFSSELIFRAVVNLPIMDWSTLRIFLGTNVIGLVFGIVFSFTPRILGNILSFIVALISTIYAIAHAGFQNYIGVYLSFGTSSQAGAVRDYITDYFASFSWTYWLILIPLGFMLLYYIFIDKKFKTLQDNETIDFAEKFDSEERRRLNKVILKRHLKIKRVSDMIAAIVMLVLFGGLYFGTLTIPFMQNELQLKHNKDLFVNPDMPNIAVGQFGYNVYSVLDVKTLLFPPKEVIDTTFDNGYIKPVQVITDYSRKIDDTLFEGLIKKGEMNKNQQKLSNYFISQEITDKHALTGTFEDKNLIVIMMESTNDILINKEFFPNFYKLYEEGWAWTNSYSPRNSCSTGNNEMSGMVSLYTINSSCTANMYKKNVYPHAIFNLFKKAGYTTSSYHNYTEQYYARKTIHPNMGSDKYYGVQDLGISYSNVYHEWPSDVDLIEKVLELTQEQDKFMAWVTAVSAHQPYTQDSELSKQYFDYFKDTTYNATLKRYLAKLKVFDDSLGVLLEGLEKQGKLDDTVIVLYADHYPYGLTTNTINSYLDYDVKVDLEVDRTPFVIYNSTITASKYDEYTSYMNLVPTIANLFDLDYDPRFYAGKDILSENYENRVIFANGSWKDEKGFYNASNGTMTYSSANDTYTAEQIKEINTIVKNRIQMSNLAIKINYFDFLFTALEDYEKELIKQEEEEANKNNRLPIEANKVEVSKKDEDDDSTDDEDKDE